MELPRHSGSQVSSSLRASWLVLSRTSQESMWSLSIRSISISKSWAIHPSTTSREAPRMELMSTVSSWKDAVGAANRVSWPNHNPKCFTLRCLISGSSWQSCQRLTAATATNAPSIRHRDVRVHSPRPGTPPTSSCIRSSLCKRSTARSIGSSVESRCLLSLMTDEPLYTPSF